MRRNHKKRRRHMKPCVTGMNSGNQLQIAIIQIGKNFVHSKNYAILSPCVDIVVLLYVRSYRKQSQNNSKSQPFWRHLRDFVNMVNAQVKSDTTL